jgi:hypothetical protein
MGTPAEQVSHTKNAQRAGHVQDGQQVLQQSGTGLSKRAASDFLCITPMLEYHMLSEQIGTWS